MGDQVDQLLEDWNAERPELDYSPLGVVVRIQLLGKLLQRSAEVALRPLKLKLWEYDVLSALRRKGKPFEQPATELARLTMLTSGAMTTRVDRLEAKGLVERTTDPEDRRGVNVKLTKNGLGVIDQAIQTRLEIAEAQLKSLSERESKSLTEGLRKLLVSVSEK
ncbi:MAG: MarR family transcriptional regulator [Gammaproteobacteria bacterium]|nr:MarR family transcriptional regulator [Gammaproteobacteria bacterium]